jgi:hypothetical protein
MSLFDEVRGGCKWVAQNAQHVRISFDRIAEYAQSLPLDHAVAPTLDPRVHYVGHGEPTANFVLILDAINFGSGYFPHLKKRPGLSGYFTVAAGLNDHFNIDGPLTVEQLMRIGALDCARIFGQHPLEAGPIVELMELFARALNDLGRFTVDRFGGRLMNIVESCNGSAEKLVRTLSLMRFYDDVRPYRGRTIKFYKRAQLTAADLAIAFNGEQWGRFDDLSALTIFADNLVPHVLRIDGILQYSPALAERIDREELIPVNSSEEVELRACAVHAVALMAAALQLAGTDMTEAGLDYVLWNRGQQPQYKQAMPRHRTRTVSY